MKIGIHHIKNSFSDYWINYCKEKEIEYKLVNCYQNDIIAQLADCQVLMWHHSQNSPKDILFAKQLLYSIQLTGMKVFPDFKTNWHFDDKVGQKYLFDTLEIPTVPTFIFYNKYDAKNWSESATYPIVFKLRCGAGSSNVKLVNSRRRAKKLIDKAFGTGFRHYNPLAGLNERIRKYKNGQGSIVDIIKGIIRFVYYNDYVKISGKDRGYIYFQEYIHNNDSDIRVVVIKDKAFAIKRMVRKGDFRASGSGSIEYGKSIFNEDIIKLSFIISDRLQMQCVAFDYVYKNNRPLILEISYGFSPEGYLPCPGYWDKNLNWYEGKFNPYGWMVENLLQS